MASHTVYNSAVDYHLPDIDTLSLIFERPESATDEETTLHVEAAHPENRINKSQARHLTKNVAHTLRNSYGIGANGAGKDVVVCISSGQILLPVVFWATIAAGGVYSSASNSFTSQELARQLSQGSAILLVTSPDCEAVARRAANDVGLDPSRILVLDSTSGNRCLVDQNNRNLLAHSAGQEQLLDWERITDKETLQTRTICLLYSSGTTGPPKGVTLTHANIVTHALIYRYAYRDYVSRCRISDPGFQLEYRTFGHLPTAHIAGCQGYFVHPAVIGGPVFWMPKFNFDKFLEYNKKFKITFFFTVPPIYLLIAQSPKVTDQFKSLRHAVSGAAPMGPDLTARAEKKLGCAISQTWGLSETTGGVTSRAWDEKDDTCSLSPIIANTRLRVVDDDENDVPDGQAGEFILSGPTVAAGYWKNPEATKGSFTSDGKWFKTGDIGLRRDGKLFIVDRKKELIKYKGMQVAPAELEALLLSHPLIDDAAVIGVPDPAAEGNEVPRAYIVADSTKVSEPEVKRFVSENLAPHKQLRGGVVYVEMIPKSANGKILRRKLRESPGSGRGASKL